jgi:[ribosomal protein S5]-alanine N-acetyltransferase
MNPQHPRFLRTNAAFAQTETESAARALAPEPAGTLATALPAAAPVASIITKRLMLRPYRPEDEASFIALNADPMVRRHLEGPLSPATARVIFGRLLPGEAGATARGWAITCRGAGDYLGHAFLVRVAETSVWEMGFMLRITAWGNGYATEVARALVRYALVEAGIRQVIASADAQNSSLIKVLEKIGMSLHSRMGDVRSAGLIFSIGPRAAGQGFEDEIGIADPSVDVGRFLGDRLRSLC